MHQNNNKQCRSHIKISHLTGFLCSLCIAGIFCNFFFQFSNFINTQRSFAKLQHRLLRSWMIKKYQEEPIKAKISQYEFIYTEGEPNTLIMFADIEEVIQGMFNKLIYQVIWIRNFPDAQKIEFISTYLQVKIKCLTDPCQAIQFLQNSNSQDPTNINRYILICSYQLTHKQHKSLKQYPHLHLINYTPINQQYQNPVDTNPEDIDFNIYVETEEQLIQRLKLLTTQKIEWKQFSNFHFIPFQNYIINHYIRIVSTMIKMDINLELRAKIVDKLEKLVWRLEELDEEYRLYRGEIREFLGELRGGRLSDARVIFWYTSELPIYKLLNNLFRSYHNPSHIFYIQPFFKDLFHTIQHQSKKSLSQLSQKKKLTFYRGGTISTKQFELIKQNISNIIQSSSFLSTSRKQKVALDYEKNLKIEIEIQSTYIHLYEQLFAYGIGFVFIGDNSCYSNQCQVLFSPLNLFKILEAKDVHVGGVHSYYVKLKHYCLLECKDEDNQHINQKFLCSILTQSIRSYYGPQYLYFGSIFFPTEVHIFSKIMYAFWNKFYQIANNSYSKKIGALNLAKINLYYNNFHNAIHLLQTGYNTKPDTPKPMYNISIQQQQLYSFKVQEKQIQSCQFQILHTMTNILISLRKYNQALFQIKTRKYQLNKLKKNGYFKLYNFVFSIIFYVLYINGFHSIDQIILKQNLSLCQLGYQWLYIKNQMIFVYTIY